MPTVNILGPDKVYPDLAQVLRDDQTVTWRLIGNLAWDTTEGSPVRFLGETEVYSVWPGSPPEPVGPAPEPGGFDQREYTANAGQLMPPREFRFYHYEISVIVIPTGHRFKVSLRRGDEWYDPEIVNEPRP